MPLGRPHTGEGGGQEFRKEGESDYRLNAPDCKLSPDKGPGHTKSPT